MTADLIPPLGGSVRPAGRQAVTVEKLPAKTRPGASGQRRDARAADEARRSTGPAANIDREEAGAFRESVGEVTGPPSTTRRLRARHWEPLLVNASALALNSVATSALGVVYWMVTARYYSAEQVGLSCALISTVLFLSGLARLNLGAALTRFLPQPGVDARRFVVWAYAVATALGVTVSIAALPFLSRSPAIQSFFHGGLPFEAWFVIAVVAACLFTIQDGALVGLRQAVWVPVENTAFSVAKLGLVVALAGVSQRLGIFASWTIPWALSVVPVSLLLFRRLLPRHSASKPPGRFAPRQVASFIAVDSVGNLAALLSTALLPLIVLSQVGAEANAYFSVPWLMRSAFDTALIGVGMSLTVEGTADPSGLARFTGTLARRLFTLAIPGVGVALLAAPQLLSLFGGRYATQGDTLLRLLVLGTLPRIATILWESTARVHRRMARVSSVNTARAVLLTGLSVPLLARFGIAGVGIAYLVAETLLAALLVPSVWGMFTSRPQSPGGALLPTVGTGDPDAPRTPSPLTVTAREDEVDVKC